MVRVKEVIVVEGRCDKNALLRAVDATVVCTDGFRIFREPDKRAMLRALAKERGLVLLTDPDGAGALIRGHLSGLVDPKYVRHAYVPDVYGKEKRKRLPSKEGKLGVEGMDPETLLEALRRAGATLDETPPPRREPITKADLCRLGLSGAADSAARRRDLQAALALPERMSANQLLQVLNVLSSLPELEALMGRDPAERPDPADP